MSFGDRFLDKLYETGARFDTLKDKSSRTVEKLVGETNETAADVGKKLAKGSAGVLVVLSLLMGIAFNASSDLTSENPVSKVNRPPVIMELDEYGNAIVDDDDDDATEQKQGRMGLVAKFRQAVMNLPRAARVWIAVPLWAIGTGIMTAISTFWNFLFATPLGGVILSAFVGFGVLLGLYLVTAKLLFPDIPVSKLLSKNSFVVLAGAAVILALVDAAIPLFWREYPIAAWAVKFGVGASVVGILTIKIKRLFNKELKLAAKQTALSHR